MLLVADRSKETTHRKSIKSSHCYVRAGNKGEEQLASPLLSVTSMTILSLGPWAFRPSEEELLSSEPTAEVPPLALKFGELDLLMCVGVEQGVRLGLSNFVRTVNTNSPLRIC